MKKFILIIAINFAFLTTIAHAATCTDAWQSTQNDLVAQYNDEMWLCPWADLECMNAAQTNYNGGTLINYASWAICCAFSPANC